MTATQPPDDGGSEAEVLEISTFDDADRVVVLGCCRDAFEEAALAVNSGSEFFGGKRGAIFHVDSLRRLRHVITVPGPGVLVFVINANQLAAAGRDWYRMCFPSEDDSQVEGVSFLDAIPDSVEISHLICSAGWNKFNIDVLGSDDGVKVWVKGAVVGPTYSAMDNPATWENSDPVGLLRSELGIDGADIITLPARVFSIAALTVPISGVFALLALIEFSVAVTVFGVLLGFALAPSWERYVQSVRGHREQARGQGKDPSMWLVRRTIFFLFGVAVRIRRTPHESMKQVEYSDYLRTSRGRESPEVESRLRHAKIRRPRFFWDRFTTRRRTTWWERRVQPVYGSYPPERHIRVSPRFFFRSLDKLWCRWVLWRVRRTLLRHASSTTEAMHTLDRFWAGAYWRPERRTVIPTHSSTLHFASHMMFPSSSYQETQWPPPSRKNRPVEVPITLGRTVLPR